MRTSLVCFAALTFAGLTGCAASASTADEVETATENLTSDQCTARIQKKVLERAQAINETASIVGMTTLYTGRQGDSFADAVLVRVSDEVEPSDYLVIRSRLRDGVVDASTCTIEHVTMVAEGLLPDDEKLADGEIGAACDESIRAAVLEKHEAITDIASVEATKLVYGKKTVFGGIALVRVSDEVEPSHYVVSYDVSGSQEASAGKCQVKLVEMLNSGTLPEIPGLDDR